MLNAIAGPVISGLIALFRNSNQQPAIKGVPQNAVDGVLDAFEAFATKDERAQKFAAAQMEKARQHDIATFDKTDIFTNRLRSSVRPLTTFVAMSWYIYARLNNIPLTAEDYTIIGGILAFWFGFRPFEKRRD